jgi:hypothetical protein
VPESWIGGTDGSAPSVISKTRANPGNHSNSEYENS